VFGFQNKQQCPLERAYSGNCIQHAFVFGTRKRSIFLGLRTLRTYSLAIFFQKLFLQIKKSWIFPVFAP